MTEETIMSSISREERDEDEAYEIGLRDGYDKAVQDIDLLTGGDGEYRACLGPHDPDRYCPDAETMKRRISARFAALSPDERLIEALEWWDRQATSWLGTREEHARPGWMQPAIEKGRDALSTTKADQ